MVTTASFASNLTTLFQFQKFYNVKCISAFSSRISLKVANDTTKKIVQIQPSWFAKQRGKSQWRNSSMNLNSCIIWRKIYSHSGRFNPRKGNPFPFCTTLAGLVEIRTGPSPILPGTNRGRPVDPRLLHHISRTVYLLSLLLHDLCPYL